MWWNIFCALLMCANYFWRVDMYIILPDTGLFSAPTPHFWNGKWWVKSGRNRFWVRRHGFTKSSNSRWYSGTKYCNQVARSGWNTNTQKRNMIVPITWKLVLPQAGWTNFDHHLSGSKHQSHGFSSSLVWVWDVDHKESWALKNWCFWNVML